MSNNQITIKSVIKKCIQTSPGYREGDRRKTGKWRPEDENPRTETVKNKGKRLESKGSIIASSLYSWIQFWP